VMLYVDGMNGVIAHNATVQWLYKLISSAVSISHYYAALYNPVPLQER